MLTEQNQELIEQNRSLTQRVENLEQQMEGLVTKSVKNKNVFVPLHIRVSSKI